MWMFAKRGGQTMGFKQVPEGAFVLGIRQLPSTWVNLELPLGLSEQQALRHAFRVARQRRLRCSLRTPTGRVFWINAAGRLVGSSRSA